MVLPSASGTTAVTCQCPPPGRSQRGAPRSARSWSGPALAKDHMVAAASTGEYASVASKPNSMGVPTSPAGVLEPRDPRAGVVPGTPAVGSRSRGAAHHELRLAIESEAHVRPAGKGGDLRPLTSSRRSQVRSAGSLSCQLSAADPSGATASPAPSAARAPAPSPARRSPRPATGRPCAARPQGSQPRRRLPVRRSSPTELVDLARERPVRLGEERLRRRAEGRLAPAPAWRSAAAGTRRRPRSSRARRSSPVPPRRRRPPAASGRARRTA